MNKGAKFSPLRTCQHTQRRRTLAGLQRPETGDSVKYPSR